MPTHEQHKTAAEDRVPTGQLIAYGMGGLISIALFNIAGQLIGLLGNISLGLSAIILNTILIVPRLWDALSDPFIGHLSDNTRSRWGRRRPYILIGGLAVAVSFVAMWWVPRGEWIRDIFPSDAAYNWFQLLYILVGLLVFFTACTVFEIPHGALGLEMSSDYHERTRLFSAKSFLGNLFAMGTPWLIFLAGLEFFRGNGDLTDGMRYVSMFIAAAVIPLVFWWFFALKEPRLVATEAKNKPRFVSSVKTTFRNLTFLKLVAIIFTLATGFNFVQLFNYYITIFYLYGGDAVAAGKLLGINGTVWAITGLAAVVPLNVISRRIGKKATLLISILLMCAAQLAKIVCYNPEQPYLILIPTVLLSTGMLMFFTLGASMVGDVCDEDELNTGSRAEGMYFSVFWWFLKMGMAIASFVTGLLLAYTHFDETQNVAADSLQSSIAVIEAESQLSPDEDSPATDRFIKLNEQLEKAAANAKTVEAHLQQRIEREANWDDHTQELLSEASSIRSAVEGLQANAQELAQTPGALSTAADKLLSQTSFLRRQSPHTLFRLRLVEIGLPLALSIVSIALTLRYPLTEERCYEIKAELKRRRANVPA